MRLAAHSVKPMVMCFLLQKGETYPEFSTFWIRGGFGVTKREA